VTEAAWTLDQLIELVNRVLSQTTGLASRIDRRIRSVPDRRAIRWYTTIGLLDRPVLRGRTGWYGPRHLLQLVAIKRRQAQGRTLAEIQQELTGAPTTTLHAIAGISAAELDAIVEAWMRSTGPAGRDTEGPVAGGNGVADPSGATPPTARPRERFWATTAAVTPAPTPATFADWPVHAAAVSPDGRLGAETAAGPVPTREHPTPATPHTDATPSLGHVVDLGRGVLLVITHPRRTPDPGDIAALGEAAAPVLDLLTARGVLPDTDTASAVDAHPRPGGSS